MAESKYTKEIALTKLMTRCSVAEKCCGDLHKKLYEWGFARADAEWIINELVRQKFVDDARYADAYVRDKSRFNGWGENKIRQMLRSKSVDKQVIEQSLLRCIDKKMADEKCYNILKNKIKSVKYDNKFQLKNKLMAFGMGRGYDFDILDKHISKLIGELK